MRISIYCTLMIICFTSLFLVGCLNHSSRGNENDIIPVTTLTTQNVDNHDPIIGSWINTTPRGYSTLSINSNGEFDATSTGTDNYGYKHSLAPLHGTWVKQENGTYNFTSHGWIHIMNYSSSQDVIFENITMYLRQNSPIKNSI